MLDWRRIQELQSEVGEVEFKLILELSLDEVEAVIMRLHGQHDDGLRCDLHLLNGCARNLGFIQLATLCEQAEAQVSNGKFERPDLDRILMAYAMVKNALISGLSGLAGVKMLLRSMRA